MSENVASAMEQRTEWESSTREWLDVWCAATRAAYKLTYGERRASLKGKRVKSFDDRGLHPYSEQWGRITLAESFLTDLPWLSPASLRSLAERDAYQDFINDMENELREETSNVDAGRSDQRAE